MSEVAKGWISLVVADLALVVLGVWVFSSDAARFVVVVAASVYTPAMVVRLRGTRRDRLPRA